MVTNNSDVEYLLELAQPPVGFDCQRRISLKAHHSVLVELTGISEEVAQLKTLGIHFFVRNMFISPDEKLNILLKIKN